MKNGISDGAGPQAYALFTDGCMKRMPSWLSLPSRSETYDSFGKVTGGVHDLQPVLAEMREARRVYLNAEDADFDGRFETAFAPEVVWQYFVDPDKRLRWQPGQTAVTAQPNPGGRMGAGASTHCAHGEGNADGLREYLDWRPFSYFTNRYTSLHNGNNLLDSFDRVMETTEFTRLEDGGTAVNWRIRIEDRSESALRKFDEQMADIRKLFPLAWIPLNKVMEEDGFTSGGPEPDTDARDSG